MLSHVWRNWKVGAKPILRIEEPKLIYFLSLRLVFRIFLFFPIHYQLSPDTFEWASPPGKGLPVPSLST